MKISNDLDFDCPNNEHFAAQQVFQLFPTIFNDSRGYFTEVFKCQNEWPKENIPLWFSSLSWIRQINRSSSQKNTIRGCHAQNGIFCQGKLVEALTEKIYDIIIDARPDSKTFGVTKAYVLDPIVQNKLWVPRGFLHSFVVPEVKSDAVFQYFCDNTYNKESEFGINPLTVLPKIVDLFYKNSSDEFADLCKVFDCNPILSDKDKENFDYQEWMTSVQDEYVKSGNVWYR